jgi:hypothetical protein
LCSILVGGGHNYPCKCESIHDPEFNNYLKVLYFYSIIEIDLDEEARYKMEVMRELFVSDWAFVLTSIRDQTILICLSWEFHDKPSVQ